MVKRVQNFLRRLHHDEVGLNTVEVILLLVIAIVLLIGIWAFVRWAMGKFSEEASELESQDAEYSGPGG